jgi:2-polyprenyl-3-methyl-5-hydroxy-6-metoxy-1,4-benzoquinol methylase
MLLSRHQKGDWGDVEELTRQKNDLGIQTGLQLHSRYILGDGTELLLETAADCSATCLFLEEEQVVQEVDAQNGYAMWADTYDKGRNPLIESEEGPVTRLIEGLPISSVLDVGTGTGRYALKFARRGTAVTAIDQSPEMLALAQQVASTENLNIDFRLASLDDDLPFAAHQFDFLVCALMLSHVPNLAMATQKFYHVLQPAGHLLLTAYHPDIIKHGGRTVLNGPGITFNLPNVSRTRTDYLETLAATGFTVLNVLDVPVRDIPPGILPEAAIEKSAEINFCLIILAQKA